MAQTGTVKLIAMAGIIIRRMEDKIIRGRILFFEVMVMVGHGR